MSLIVQIFPEGTTKSSAAVAVRVESSVRTWEGIAAFTLKSVCSYRTDEEFVPIRRNIWSPQSAPMQVPYSAQSVHPVPCASPGLRNSDANPLWTLRPSQYQ